MERSLLEAATMRLSLSVLTLLLVVGSTTTALADEGTSPPAEAPALPRRSGFTMELGLGASFMNVDSHPNVESAKFGLAPLSFGLGGFFSRDFALTFRGTGASLFQDRGGATEQVLLGYYGPSLQYYVAEPVFIGAGVGLGVLLGNPLGSRARGLDPIASTGLGTHARLGWAFYATKAHQFSLVTEGLYARTDDANALGITLALGWQYF